MRNKSLVSELSREPGRTVASFGSEYEAHFPGRGGTKTIPDDTYT